MRFNMAMVFAAVVLVGCGSKDPPLSPQQAEEQQRHLCRNADGTIYRDKYGAPARAVYGHDSSIHCPDFPDSTR